MSRSGRPSARRPRLWWVAAMAFVVSGCPTPPETPDVSVALHNPGDQVVSVPFTVSADVKFQGGGLRSFQVASTWLATGPVSPSTHDSDKNEVTESFTDQLTFTCTAAGSATIKYDVALSGSDTKEASDTTSFACRDEPPAPTGSPEASVPPKPTKFKTLVTNGVAPVGKSGVEGQVQLLAASQGATGTDIVIEVKGPAESLPVTLNEGGCDTRGPLVQALTATTNGESTTTLPGALSSYLTGTFSVHLGTSLAKPETDIACGVIARAHVISLGPGAGGDQTPADAVLVDQAPYGTEVSVYATPADRFTQQPLAIVKASCPASGTVAFKLQDTQSGRSTTDVEATLDALLSGGYSIQLSQSGAAPNSIVVCGNLTP